MPNLFNTQVRGEADRGLWTYRWYSAYGVDTFIVSSPSLHIDSTESCECRWNNETISASARKQRRKGSGHPTPRITMTKSSYLVGCNSSAVRADKSTFLSIPDCPIVAETVFSLTLLSVLYYLSRFASSRSTMSLGNLKGTSGGWCPILRLRILHWRFGHLKYVNNLTASCGSRSLVKVVLAIRIDIYGHDYDCIFVLVVLEGGAIELRTRRNSVRET